MKIRELRKYYIMLYKIIKILLHHAVKKYFRKILQICSTSENMAGKLHADRDRTFFRCASSPVR